MSLFNVFAIYGLQKCIIVFPRLLPIFPDYFAIP